MSYEKNKMLSLMLAFVLAFAIFTTYAGAESGAVKDAPGGEYVSTGEGIWYEDASSYKNYYSGIIAESLQDLINFKQNGGDEFRIRLNLSNKIDAATSRKASMSQTDIAEVNRVLEYVKAEIAGLEYFESLYENIDEFENGPKKETEESQNNSSAEKAPEKKPLVQGFSDVKPEDWFYDTVMEMTNRGLFAGKGQVVDGIGTFAPYDVMTRAEFNAVLCRAMFGDVANEQVEGKLWWYKSDSVLRGYAIIKTYDFTDTVEVPMTREEMAYMCSNAFTWSSIWKTKIAENPIVYDNLDGAKDKIPDYNKISDKYLDGVVTCYSQGIICGVDNLGTFNPSGHLTRAEAASVIYRLLERDARTPVDLSVKLEVRV